MAVANSHDANTAHANAKAAVVCLLHNNAIKRLQWKVQPVALTRLKANKAKDKVIDLPKTIKSTIFSD